MRRRRAEKVSSIVSIRAGADQSPRYLPDLEPEPERMEEALSSMGRLGEEYFRALIDVLPAAIYTTDAQGRITHFNPACVDFSGRTPELGTDHWSVTWKLYYPDGRPMPHSACPMAIALAEQRAVRGERAIAERPDGTRVWFEPYPTPLFDDSGALIGGVNMLVDITERTRAEQALRESEVRFRNLADSAPAMLWVTEPDGSAAFVSRGWREYTGQDESQCADAFGWLDAVHPDDRDAVRRAFLETNGRREPFSIDFRVRRADGAYRWCIDAGRPRFDERGTFVGYVGSVIDVHERKQAEHALWESQAQLTAELADAKLLARASAELIREENVQAVYESLIDAAVSVMRSDFASMQMLHPERGEGGELRLLAFRGFNPRAARFWEWVRTDSKCTCGVALATGQRCIEPDVANSPFMAGTADQATYLQTGIHAVQSTPLVSRSGNLVGMLSTHWKQPHEPTERDLRLLDVLARQAADLIDRMRSEEAVKASEERYRQLANLLPVALYTCDATGVITYFNEHAARLWGRSPEPGDTDERFYASELLHLADGEALPHDHSPMALALRDGSSYREQAVDIRRPDGSRVSVSVNIDPVRDGTGRIVGAINAFHDVTELRRAEAAAAKLAAIVQSSTDAIVSKDLNGIVTSWNVGAELLFGYTAEETVGRPVTMLVPPDRLGEEADILARIMRGERIEHFETKRQRKDGSLLDLSLTVSPIKDADGRIVGASKIARDITERLQAQEALREADRRKDEFLAMLAHELRGPLAPLRYVLDIMKRSASDDELLRQARDSMDRQLGQLVRLVDDLLDVSRISRGRIELKRERIELAPVLRQAIEACRPWAESAGVDLIHVAPPEPMYLHADAARLAQVLSNLLHNSCKYNEPGGEVRITAAREGGDVVLVVKDTGVGIPPEKLAGIFEMFAQVDQSLTRSQGGLGIGLTLVKRLVELHGGSVSAFSEGPNTGSEFVIRLPLLGDENDARATPQPVVEEQRSMRRQILVVDDNVDSATSLAMLLNLTGNQTQTRHDGLQAVEAAEKFRPDVALLDIGLPKLDGYEACRRIRAQPWGKDIRLVALTGWGQDEDRRRSKEAGFDAHLVKPVDFGVLKDLLEQWTDDCQAD